jgi:hypothetical protein
MSGALAGGKPMAGTGYLGYDAAGVVDEVGETGERGLRLLKVNAGDTLFVDGGAGGVGAVAVQMALARGAKVIASASEANHDYLRELGATPVGYSQGLAERVRAAAGGRVDAVLDVAGKTPVQDLISLAPEPSQVVTIANYAAGQAGARVTGGGADRSPHGGPGAGGRVAGPEQAGDQGPDLPVRPRRRGLPHHPVRPRPRKTCPRPLTRHGLSLGIWRRGTRISMSLAASPQAASASKLDGQGLGDQERGHRRQPCPPHPELAHHRHRTRHQGGEQGDTEHPPNAIGSPTSHGR